MNKGGRVCFSFPAGTLDLAELAPRHTLARSGLSGTTVALRLGARQWPEWIGRLGAVVLHVRNAWAMGAASLPRAEFLPVPGSREWVEAHTGCVAGDMIRWRAQAFVEPWGPQEVGGVAFIDEDACERLRLYLSQISDLEAFDEMIASQNMEGALRAWQPYPSATQPAVQLKPSAFDVLRAWEGLGKHLDSDGHHGWPGVSRRAWLAAAGPANARPQPPASLLRLLCACAKHQAPLTLLPHVPDTHAPITLHPQRIERCACGVHIFGRSAQYKLCTLEKMELWLALYPNGAAGGRFVWHAFDPEGRLAWTLKPAETAETNADGAWNRLCEEIWEGES